MSGIVAEVPPTETATEPSKEHRMGVPRFAAVTTAVGSGICLWAASTPSWSFLGMLLALAVLGLAGLTWGAWVLMTAVESRRGPRRAVWPVGWVLAAPVLVVLTGVLLVADVPFEARWAHSRPAFEEVVENAQPDLPRGQTIGLGVGTEIGTYDVRHARQQGDAVIFTLDGGLFDDVGVAYLPDGPFPELENGGFERPRFTPIGDGWYTWSASW